jgi:uncharacterized membrane protein
MNADVEELLRDGMERFTAGVHAPAGLARTAARLRQRRLVARSAITTGTAVVTAAIAAAVANGSPSSTSLSNTHVRTAAYVVKRVEKALAGANLVFQGRTTGSDGPSVTWSYGSRWRFEEFTGRSCGHTRRDGECTHRGGSERYLAEGTALISGKLTGAYVTYFDRKYSLSGGPGHTPANACTTTGALSMGGPPVPTNHWAGFINQTLRCGAATVTGNVRVDGVETTRITGAPVTVRLSPGYAKTVHEKWARARWTLYVDPTTYLPVRMYGSTETFGGPGGGTLDQSVTDGRWLPPTAANTRKALVTIPPGFHQVSSAADQ